MISQTAILDIREEVGLGVEDWTAQRAVLKLMLRDLLAAYDDAEAWCARLAHDSGRYEEGAVTATSKAIRAITRLMDSHRDDYSSLATDALAKALREVTLVCGSAEPLPPHEVTLAENRRMRAALEKIVARQEVSLPNARTEMSQIARDALEGKT